MEMSTCSDSESSDDEHYGEPLPVMVPGLWCPFDKHQGFFLANLAKLLDDAPKLYISFALRWSDTDPCALQINWGCFVEKYYLLRDILVAYKMTRACNRVRSARASWNRKLREWEFIMTTAKDGVWTTYTYKDTRFRANCDYTRLPVYRR